MKYCINNNILSVDDTIYRGVNLDALIGTRCQIIKKDGSITDSEIYRVEGIRTDFYKGLSYFIVSSSEFGSIGSSIQFSKQIRLLDKEISYSPFDLNKKSVRNYLLNKVIRINKEDSESMSILFSNKNKIYENIITGFYKNKKGKWFVTTNQFKIDSYNLYNMCTFMEKPFHENEPVAAIELI